MSNMGWRDAVLIAASSLPWKNRVAVIVNRCHLIACEIAVPWDALPFACVNGLDTLRATR